MQLKTMLYVGLSWCLCYVYFLASSEPLTSTWQFVTLSPEPRTLTCISYPSPWSVIIYLWLSPQGQGQFSIIT